MLSFITRGGASSRVRRYLFCYVDLYIDLCQAAGTQ